MADTEKKQSDSNRRYTEATRRLREAHADEFQALLEKVYAEEGATYKRRLTAEERAEKQEQERKAAAARKIEALLEQYPDLLDEGKAPPALVDPAFSATA